MDNEITEQNTVVLPGGNVDYALKDCAVAIDDLIEALEGAKQDGAEFVVLSSGNFRGAMWARLSTNWSWADDEI